jgi:hypothetical protein
LSNTRLHLIFLMFAELCCDEGWVCLSVSLSLCLSVPSVAVMKGARLGTLWRTERRINADNAWLLERLRRSWAAAGLAANKTVDNSHLISLPNCFSSAALDRTQYAAASSEHSRARTRSGRQPPRERWCNPWFVHRN